MVKLAKLTVYDYIVVVGMQIFCAGGGLILGGKGPKDNTLDNYILGQRVMSPIPVGFSLVATTLSAVAMSGGVGEIYLYGLQYFLLKVSASLSCIVALYLLVPIFYQYPFLTLHEYVGMRFSPALRILYTVIYLIGYMLYLAAVLYVPATALGLVSGLPFWVSVIVAGGLVIFYCFVGGMRAIIYTDALQLIFMLLCFLVVTIQGSIILGGADNVLDASKRGGRWQTFQLYEDDETRYSVWSIIINGFLLSISTVCASQAGVQRLLCVSGYDAVKKTLYTAAIMTMVFAVLLAGASLVIFTYFEDCDPLFSKRIEHPDDLLVFFISKALSDIPGLKGLAVGGIFCGSLSSLSSYINSFAAVAVVDLVKIITPKWCPNEKIAVWQCQFFTLLFGLICIGVTFVVPLLGGVTDVFQAIVGTAGGPLLAVLCIGMFSRKINNMAAIVSLIIGLVLTLWITIGAFITEISYATLPLSISGCNATSNFSLHNNPDNLTEDDEFQCLRLHLYPNTILMANYWENVTAFGVSHAFSLYKMSPLWYGPLGFSITAIIAWVWGCFLETDKTIDERLISPLLKDNPTLDENANIGYQPECRNVVLTKAQITHGLVPLNVTMLPDFRVFSEQTLQRRTSNPPYQTVF